MKSPTNVGTFPQTRHSWRRYFGLSAILVVAWSGNPWATAQPSSPPLAQLKAAAEAGNPAAQEELARAYRAALDFKNAEAWFRKAAQQGHPAAQTEMGDILLNQARAPVSKPELRKAHASEALGWYRLAAGQGYARGQLRLGELLAAGKEFPADLPEAYQWLELAANGSPADGGGQMAQFHRDRVILKMSSEQIAEGRRRAATFVPRSPTNAISGPEPGWASQLKLMGISGAPGRELATINGRVLAAGESAKIKLIGQEIPLRCVSIARNSVVVSAGQPAFTKELKLSGTSTP